jgi:hypothetical protein
MILLVFTAKRTSNFTRFKILHFRKMAGSEAALAVLLVAGVAMTRAQVPALGPCPGVDTMHSFNMQRVRRLFK